MSLTPTAPALRPLTEMEPSIEADVRRAIYDFLHADLHMREARAILEFRRQAVVAMMAGERMLETPEFFVTQDLGMVTVTCWTSSAQEER